MSERRSRRQTASAHSVRQASMSDVARLAGVSAQTVSRVLSDYPHVREQTKSRVLAAVGQLGYRPNGTARALATGRTRTLGVFTLESNSYSRSTISHGIEIAAREAGYFVSTASTLSLSSRAAITSLAWLLDQRVDGIIIAAPLTDVDDELTEMISRLPTVAIDGARTASTEIVTVDQYAAGRLATKHLLELGVDTVWHLAGPPSWSDASRRTEGWRDALTEAGREVPPLMYGDWTPEAGYRNGLILGRAPEVQALFVASDDMAFGVIRALIERGRRVPEDVAVVGMDDTALAAYCTPPLTTIRQPFAEIGRRAVEHLLAQINDPGTAAVPELISPELVVRRSSVR